MSHKPLETGITDPLAYPELCVRTDERLRSLGREQDGLSPTSLEEQQANTKTRLAPLVQALEGSGRF